jgi:hypothetical protein
VTLNRRLRGKGPELIFEFGGLVMIILSMVDLVFFVDCSSLFLERTEDGRWSQSRGQSRDSFDSTSTSSIDQIIIREIEREKARERSKHISQADDGRKDYRDVSVEDLTCCVSHFGTSGPRHWSQQGDRQRNIEKAWIRKG